MSEDSEKEDYSDRTISDDDESDEDTLIKFLDEDIHHCALLTADALGDPFFPRTTQILLEYQLGRWVPRLRKPRDLYGVSSSGPLSPTRWPYHCEVIDEKVKHIDWTPLFPEPVYVPTGLEIEPAYSNTSEDTVVYLAEDAYKEPCFVYSRVGGNRTPLKQPADNCDNTLMFEARFESGNLQKGGVRVPADRAPRPLHQQAHPVVLLPSHQHAGRHGVQVHHRQLHQAGQPVQPRHAAPVLLGEGGAAAPRGLAAHRGADQVLQEPAGPRRPPALLAHLDLPVPAQPGHLLLRALLPLHLQQPAGLPVGHPQRPRALQVLQDPRAVPHAGQEHGVRAHHHHALEERRRPAPQGRHPHRPRAPRRDQQLVDDEGLPGLPAGRLARRAAAARHLRLQGGAHAQPRRRDRGQLPLLAVRPRPQPQLHVRAQGVLPLRVVHAQHDPQTDGEARGDFIL
ncbi:cytosolic carboxypeptidase 3 isoform 15-T18 [Thomomys bottae]